MPFGRKKHDVGIVEKLGRTVGGAIDATADTVLHTLGKTITHRPKMPRKVMRTKPGASPGIRPEQLEELERATYLEQPIDGSKPVPATVEFIDYGPGYDEHTIVSTVDDLQAFLDKPVPDKATTRWINVNSVADLKVMRVITGHFKLHPLAVEDVLDNTHRPKVEVYDNIDHPEDTWIFVICRMVRLIEMHLDSEQISVFIKPGLIITFQERIGDVFDPIRERIDRTGSRIREQDTSYLLYALLDAIVDHRFPILETFGDRLEAIEEEITNNPKQEIVGRIHHMRRQLLLIRREVWPMREMLTELSRESHGAISAETRVFLRDVVDHTMVIMELVETYREIAAGLADTYMTAVSNRMNEVMKVLTIIASLFIPISFLAGVYGMNFDVIPGIHGDNAFYVFVVVCLSITLGMLIYFKRKGWM